MSLTVWRHGLMNGDLFLVVVFLFVVVCSTMSKGIFALFGLTNHTTSTTTESFGRTFNMPYIAHSAPSNCSLLSSYSSSSSSSSGGGGYTVFMRPAYEGAILAVAQYYQWTHVYYLYNTDEGMLKISIVKVDGKTFVLLNVSEEFLLF